MRDLNMISKKDFQKMCVNIAIRNPNILNFVHILSQTLAFIKKKMLNFTFFPANCRLTDCRFAAKLLSSNCRRQTAMLQIAVGNDLYKSHTL